MVTIKAFELLDSLGAYWNDNPDASDEFIKLYTDAAALAERTPDIDLPLQHPIVMRAKKYIFQIAPWQTVIPDNLLIGLALAGAVGLLVLGKLPKSLR